MAVEQSNEAGQADATMSVESVWNVLVDRRGGGGINMKFTTPKELIAGHEIAIHRKINKRLVKKLAATTYYAHDQKSQLEHAVAREQGLRKQLKAAALEIEALKKSAALPGIETAAKTMIGAITTAVEQQASKTPNKKRKPTK